MCMCKGKGTRKQTKNAVSFNIKSSRFVSYETFLGINTSSPIESEQASILTIK